DKVLAQQIQRMEPFVNSALAAAIVQLLPEHPAPAELAKIVYTAMDTLRGILIASFVDGDVERARRRWARASAHLRAVAVAAFPSLG
ncbi:TetR/AcrR family transcriptional regulator, partial [Mycobacteroides abscessus subsp. abscessus]